MILVHCTCTALLLSARKLNGKFEVSPSFSNRIMLQTKYLGTARLPQGPPQYVLSLTGVDTTASWSRFTISSKYNSLCNVEGKLLFM